MGKGGGSGSGAGNGKGEGRGEGKGEGHGDGSGDYKGKTDRIAVPAMPMPMAVVCCVLNFIIPGFGTILAGFSNFCCSRNEDIDRSARCVSCMISWGIGCAQLLTAFFLLIGFCWSWAWGIYMIGMSIEYYHNNKVDDSDRPGGVVTTQPHTIVLANSSTNQAEGRNVTVINQPPGAQFGGKVVQVGNPASVIQTGHQAAPVIPPAYSGPPEKLKEDELYPPIGGPPSYSSIGVHPGTSSGDPVYPDNQEDQKKRPL